MKQHLAVSAIGSDRTGMVHELTRVISECGGNISESRMASLGTEFAMLLLVSGNWHALAKLETELKRLAETNGLSVHLKRTEPRSPRTDMLPYSIDVVCLDQSGIVSGLSGFFSSRGIDIAEVKPWRGQVSQIVTVCNVLRLPGGCGRRRLRGSRSSLGRAGPGHANRLPGGCIRRDPA